MQVDIISPDKHLYSGDAEHVKLPGTVGSFGVLKNHAPIISTLSKGSVVIKETGKGEICVDIKGGVAEVNNDRIIILAE